MLVSSTPIEDLYMIYPSGSMLFPNAVSLVYKGSEKFLIDFGLKYDEMKFALNKLGLSFEGLDHIILTHFHPDHCKSVWRIKKYFKNIEVWLNEVEFNSIKNWDSFFELYGFLNDKEMIKEWLALVGNPMDFKPFEPDRVIKWGERIKIDEHYIEFIPSAGHTPGHTFIKIDNLLVTGDIDLTDFPWYGHPKSDLEEFIRSVKKILELKPGYIVTMHRGLISGNMESEVERYLSIINERDKEIIAALKEVTTFKDLIEKRIIYPKHRNKITIFFEKHMLIHHIKRLEKIGMSIPIPLKKSF